MFVRLQQAIPWRSRRDRGRSSVGDRPKHRRRSFNRVTVSRLRTVGKWYAIVLIGAFFALPLYWVVTMSFKPAAEWNPTGEVIWFPRNPTLDNYTGILGLRVPAPSESFVPPTRSAIKPIEHSLIAAGGGTLVALAVGVLAAFGISRYRSGGRLLPFQILQLRMIPPIVLLIPIFFMFAYLHLWDTLGGLIVVYAALTFPFVVWLMRSFFQEVPRELSEAAIVDGCTHWGAFFKVVLPQVKGGLAATALFVFILNWSDLLIASVLTGERAQTAPVYLETLQADEFLRQFGPQAALAIILILPPAILGLAIQKHLVRGLTFGAIRR